MKKLDSDDVVIYKDCHIISQDNLKRINDMKDNNFAQKFFNFYSGHTFNGDSFKKSKYFPYQYLRVELQNTIINLISEMNVADKNKQELLNWSLTVIILLSLNQELVDLLQNYDYGFKVPKIIVFHNDRETVDTYNSVLLHILKYFGFDILFFTPTGYCDIENIYPENILNIFQLEECSQDFKFPFSKDNIMGEKLNFFERIFRK